jgi:hypothetical protein
MPCVGGTSKKYAFNRLALPSLLLMQVRTNFIQIEVVALEDASFLLLEKPRCPFANLVKDNISTPMNQPLAYALPNLFGNFVFLPLFISHWI